MRISDWSSDVCSSDLQTGREPFIGFIDGSALEAHQRHIGADGQDTGHQIVNSAKPLSRTRVFRSGARTWEEASPGAPRHSASSSRSPGKTGAVNRQRSEARRVGKEGVSKIRSRWSPYHEKKKKQN